MTTAIYPPPRPGLPFLLVTVSDGEIKAVEPAQSRQEARLAIVETEAQPIRLRRRRTA
jgi:hypothetical protein